MEEAFKAGERHYVAAASSAATINATAAPRSLASQLLEHTVMACGAPKID